MKLLYTSLLTLFFLNLHAQSSIKGQLQDTDNESVGFANVMLYSQADTSLTKVEVTDDAGIFQLQESLREGTFWLLLLSA